MNKMKQEEDEKMFCPMQNPVIINNKKGYQQQIF